MMAFYYATFYAQLAKAINRFFAISSPIKYRRWFSDEKSKCILVIVIFFGLIHGALYFLPDCNLYYDTAYIRWEYEETNCYEFMSTDIDLVVNCSITGITMCIDICTLFLIIKHGLLSGNSNRDVRFFIQAFTTSIIYTAVVISDQSLSVLINNRWYAFFTSTFAWEMSHAIDG